MPVRNVYIGSPVDAAQTPERIFRALTIENPEERDSDNYAQGSYHVGRAGDLEVTVWADEYSGFEEYPYKLALDLGDDSQFDVDEVLDLGVAELLKAGFTVAREVSYKDGVVERELYSLGSNSNLVKRRDTRPAPEE
jgi:hypothetical protein